MLALIYALSIELTSALSVVSIRLDDVQVHHCEDITEAILDTITGLGCPVNVGTIGRYLDTEPTFDAYLKSFAKSQLVEIVSHSYKHETYSGQSVEWQEDDLGESIDMIYSVTNVKPLSFIPPENLYDDNTIIAAKSENVSLISAQCTWDTTRPNVTINCPTSSQVVAPNIIANGIYMLPAGAVLGNIDYWSDYQLSASVSDAVMWIETQIAAQGFSVLMLHPSEFAEDPHGACSIKNQTKLDILADLIQYGQETWEFMTFQDAAKMLSA